MSLKNFLLLSILSLAISFGFAQENPDQHSDPTHTTTADEQHEGDTHQAEGHQADEHENEGDHAEGSHAEETHGHETGHHADPCSGDHSEEAGEEENEEVKDVILHHVLDNHNWEITGLPNGGEIVIKFPWFVYTTKTGFVYAKDARELFCKYSIASVHDKPVLIKEEHRGDIHLDHHGQAHLEEAELEKYQDDAFVINFSITKTVSQMLLVALILIILFIGMARSYKKREGQAPKGFQSFMEPIVVFVRDEVAKPYLGDKTAAFLPYLLTLFFFIWFANLFGLMPFNSNIAGNISFTAALAVLTFIITQVNGSKDYWVHIFNTPGVPWWLKFGIPLMPIVEFISIFTKPFALAIRLFANITAGHFMVLGLISLIFIIGNNATNPVGAWAIAPISFLFTTAIFFLELIVAIIQPYIFTLLTAVFVGMAMESHDDHH